MNTIDITDKEFKGYLFYDIEVFAEDSLVVFKNIDGDTLRIFHNNFEGLREFIEGKVLVGYNNYHYDDYVLSMMMTDYGKKVDRQKLIRSLNNEIINYGKTMGVKIDPSITSLDCFQQINVAKSSLKKIEANIGLSVEESSIPFDIDRKLTQEELKEVIEYCEHDVEATIAVFKLRWNSYFVPKLMILDMLPVPMQKRALRWNTTTITANILIGDDSSGYGLNHTDNQWHRWQLGSDQDTARLVEKVPQEAVNLWKTIERISLDDPNDATPKEEKKSIPKKYTHLEYGCAFEFSQGGLHGVNMSERRKFSDVKLLDVTSLYPNILMKLNALGKSTGKYREIVNRRVEVKHKDPVLSNALKLIINSTYGLMKNRYSKLYNPMAALSVCIYGQIALYDLCTRLYNAGYTLINVNTDGVAFTGSMAEEDGIEAYLAVQKEWEDEYGFTLELSEFKTWIQKDVNNYIAVAEDGHIKVKGAEVNHYYDPYDYLSDPFTLNAGVTWSGTNTKAIIHHCIVNKIVYEKDFVDTVVENLDKPILFQFVLQCGNTYLGTVDDEGREYQKVNRVFACRDGGVTLKKKKEGCNPQYFPNAPKNMYVYNGDLRDFENFRNIVDVDFYTKLAEEKYTKLWAF